MPKKEEVLEPPRIEWLIEPTFDQDGVQVSSGIGVDGKEYPDPVPIAPPTSLRGGDTLHESIRNLVRQELFKRAIEQEGFETFEEAEDFDIEDDPLDPLTEYEQVFDPPPGLAPGASGAPGGADQRAAPVSPPQAAPAAAASPSSNNPGTAGGSTGTPPDGPATSPPKAGA